MRFAGMALLLGVLTACATNSVDRYTAVPAPKQNEVRWINLPHEVSFPPLAAELPAVERARLMAFLGHVQASALDTVIIDSGAAADDLARARIAALDDLLRRQLPTVQPAARQVGLAPPGRDTVRVLVGRYIVIPPNCPDWSKPSGTDPVNTPSSNFGCATTANLGLMVADPGDLIRGRALSPAHGGAAALGMQRYLSGEVKQPFSQSNRSLGVN